MADAKNVFLGLLVVFVGVQIGSADEPKKMTTKQVMEKAFSGKKPLMAKILSKKADKKEIKLALNYLKAMAKNEPDSGTKESWKEKNDKLINAMMGIQKGEEKAFERLAKAINCKACHDAHQ